MSMSEVSCSRSTSSCQSLEHGSVPEILIGLLYNATTGRLSAEVIKGSHFKNLAANRPPSEWKMFGFFKILFSALMGISVLGASILLFSLNRWKWNGVIIIISQSVPCFLFPVIWEVEKFEIQNIHCKVSRLNFSNVSGINSPYQSHYLLMPGEVTGSFKANSFPPILSRIYIVIAVNWRLMLCLLSACRTLHFSPLTV